MLLAPGLAAAEPIVPSDDTSQSLAPDTAEPPPNGSAEPGAGSTPAPEPRASPESGKAPAPTEPPESTVSLVSSDPSVTFFRKTGVAVGLSTGMHSFHHFYGDNYEDLCSAPCLVKVRSGQQKFALSNGGIPVAAAPVLLPAGPATVEGEYVSYSGARWAFFGGGAAAIVGGFALTVYGSGHSKEVCVGVDQCLEENDTDGTQVGIGVGLTLAGGIAVLIASAINDEAHIRVLPGVAARALTVGDAAVVPDVRSGAFAARGLTWNVTW
jgi:hypothetical protein